MTTGRPRKEIDKKIFENLCGLQCTLEEIAGAFDCSPDTIERWCKREYGEPFADVYKKHSAKGKMSLRRTQFRLAEKSAAEKAAAEKAAATRWKLSEREIEIIKSLK